MQRQWPHLIYEFHSFRLGWMNLRSWGEWLLSGELMELDELIGKLAKWILLLQKYDFEVVHCVGITNFDANGLTHNPSPLVEDLTGAR